MDRCLSDLPYTFKIIGKNILVRKEEKQLESIKRIQLIDVKGKVYDSNGEPIVGATVNVKGTSQGTLTNENGEFSVNVAPNSILIISSIGYVTQEIAEIGRAHVRTPVTNAILEY